MDKTAQERSILNKLREKVNMPASYLDKFFKPELDRVMGELKQLDDYVRSELTGTKIGTAPAPTDAASAKDLLKEARTSLNRREYMTGIADLGRFHKKMYDISKRIEKFVIDVNKIHHKFLFEGVDDKKIQQLRSHMNQSLKKASLEEEYFIKEAGIMDFFYNIGTKRGRALAAWEKKYGKQGDIKKLIDGAKPVMDAAQALLDSTLGNLKAMATARATRRPDEYMDIANRVVAEFNKFDSGDKGFRNYYNTAIAPMLKIKDDVESGKLPELKPGQQELGGEQVSTVQTPTDVTTPPMGGGFVSPVVHPSSPVAAPTPSPTLTQVPSQIGGGFVGAPVPTTGLPPTSSVPPNIQAPEKTEEQLQSKYSHQSFYESLEALSKEDPRILAKYIAKYATSIQEFDPETAVKLFQVVRRIKG